MGGNPVIARDTGFGDAKRGGPEKRCIGAGRLQLRNGWNYVNLMDKTFRAERGAGRWGRRSGGAVRFFMGRHGGFVRKGRKIKKDAPRSARDGTYMIFGESVLGKLAMTFLMAMVPVVELRGAIPMGVAAGLPPVAATVTAMAGNLTPVPCILLLLRRVFALMRKNAWLGPKVDQLERRAHLKGRKVRKYRTLGLVLLVAIPLPGTGAWTGALVADVLDLRMRVALPAIAVGVVIAGCITTAVTCGVAELM